MKKILGLDLGTKSLGISISDLTKTVATTYGTVHFEEKDYDKALEEIATILKKEPIEKIVLGYPKNMNGSIGPRALITLEFKEFFLVNSYTTGNRRI